MSTPPASPPSPRPSRTRVKICGIKTPQDARATSLAGADAIGLNFEPRSPRYIDPDHAAPIAAAAGPFIQRVGLFTDHDLPTITHTADRLGLSLIQLHGSYSEDIVEALAPRRVIRALHYVGDGFRETLEHWTTVIDRFPNLVGLLIDTPGGRLGGGTGIAFDWAGLRATLDEVNPYTPIILAGGLVPENVADAIRTVRPWAVDVSSGVESQRGQKDSDLVAEFCKAVRTADNNTD